MGEIRLRRFVQLKFRGESRPQLEMSSTVWLDMENDFAPSS